MKKESKTFEISMLIGEDGEIILHVASILYDLWEDYLYFRAEAVNTSRESDPLRYKRMARASINAFFSYVDGGLNYWIREIDPDFSLNGASTGSKLGVIRRKISSRGGKQLPWVDTEGPKSLRNKINHLKLGDNDLKIVEELLEGRFFRESDHIVNWLRIASHRLDLECHPDVPSIQKESITSLDGSLSVIADKSSRPSG